MTQPDLSPLPATVFHDVATLCKRHGDRWRPGLAATGERAFHCELFARGDEGAGAGAALALARDDWHNTPRTDTDEAQDRRSVLWVQTRDAARLSGRPYRAGLPEDLRHRVIHVLADRAEDALFALEEGLRCRELAFVMGEIAGNPKALDFTASRRLTLVSQRHGVPLFLVRLDAERDLSSARMRWEVASFPSAAPRWNAQAPGDPVWQAELFRTRSHMPGNWLLEEGAGGRLALRTSAKRDRDSETPAMQRSSPLTA